MEIRHLKRDAMRKIAEATDASGGAKFPTFMLENMKQWERSGLIELHKMDGNLVVARITDKGRAVALRGGKHQ